MPPEVPSTESVRKRLNPLWAQGKGMLDDPEISERIDELNRLTEQHLRGEPIKSS